MTALHLTALFDFNRAHAIAARTFDAQLGGVHGIGLNDLQLLHALERAPGHRLRRIDLAQQLGLTQSGITWMLRPLVKRRLVWSAVSEHDARAVYAVLTPGGRELVADAVPTARHLAAELLEPYADKQELGQLAEVLARF